MVYLARTQMHDAAMYTFDVWLKTTTPIVSTQKKMKTTFIRWLFWELEDAKVEGWDRWGNRTERVRWILTKKRSLT